jgi:radical SAM family uncharacterized protein
MSDSSALKEILPRVEKPGRYVGGEWNAIRKRPAGANIKIALAFPDTYEIGMSYLGQKILYALLNKDREILAERVFAPWPDFERELRNAGLPLASLENGIPLGDFDILGFSLLYELNYSNVLTILDLGGVPLLAADRTDRDPLVIGGGPAAFNPEPVAEFFDLFLLGDGEEAFPEIVRTFRESRRRREGRLALLERLARMEGVYVPSFYDPTPQDGSPLLYPKPRPGAPKTIRKRVLRDFEKSFFPDKIVVPSLRVVFDRVAVEAARGCPQNCRFCQASSVYFPHRPKDAGFLIRTAILSLRQTGYEDVSLSALSVSDHPHLEPIVGCLMDELAAEKISLSLPSLRPGGLSPAIVESILKVRKTGVTLVPEAGTERLRSVINKKLSDEEIRKALSFAFSRGWRLVKFYFMAGLPTEREEDLDGIVRLVREALDLGRSVLGVFPRIHISLSSFIPKPHTPFQWLGMEAEASLAAKQRLVRSGLARAKSVEFKEHPLETSLLEAVFSRGDRRLNRVLLRAWSKGARFDSWGGRLDSARWSEAFAEEGVDFGGYLGPIDRDAVLPWEHIETGLRKSHLLRELDLALERKSSPSCRERSCADCEGCDPRFSRRPPAPFKKPLLPPPRPPLGASGGEVLRYRAVYAKRGRARYLSHIDLIHVLQRSFRRAGVDVRKTQGFHPKMDFTYGPALPLGMEGLREVVEFRSSCRFDGRRFLARMNRSLPPGLRFLSLQRVEGGAPPLSGSMAEFVYSLDWKSDDFRQALPDSGSAERALPVSPRVSELKTRLAEFVRDNPGAGTIRFVFKGRRLYLHYPGPPGKGPRPQDVVAQAFGIADAAFFLRRDEIELGPGGEN